LTQKNAPSLITGCGIVKEKPMATPEERPAYLKPIEIRRQARVPYEAVIGWIEVGHPRAGKLPAVDFSERGKRRSYRIRPEDWEVFQEKLKGPAQTRQQPSSTPPRPRDKSKGRFNY
jgi:hypothetical protein